MKDSTPVGGRPYLAKLISEDRIDGEWIVRLESDYEKLQAKLDKANERIKELEVQSYKDMDEYDDVLYQEYALAKDKDLAPKAQELKRAYVVGMRNRIKELEAKK